MDVRSGLVLLCYQFFVMAEKRTDYYWTEEPEPHIGRRRAILKDHPEIKKLYGINPWMKYSVLILVSIQIAVAIYLGQNNVPWYVFVGLTYLVGATISHALFLAIHEITHNLAFKKPALNNYLAYIANIPIVVPYAMGFKFYHHEHHWEQGKDGVDSDIPLPSEANFFRGFIGKVLWFMHQIFFYALRPMFVKKVPFDKWVIMNIVFQVMVMIPIISFAGLPGLGYLLLSLVLAGSLHPTSGHFISEHYVFHEGQETYSYYGPLNLVTYNVGYHNEHHDFPNIPGSRLPLLRKMAPEYYDNLHSYKSWTGVILKFLFSPDITLYSRTKRK